MNYLIMALLMALVSPASADRISRSQSGTADCPDKAWRVLVIGGEIQPNSWCGQSNAGDKRYGNSEHNKQVADKEKREREEYKNKQEAERAKRKAEHQRQIDMDKAKRDTEKAKRDAEREKRIAEKKVHDCHGIGAPANCQGANPGKGHQNNSGKGNNKNH